MVRVGLTGGIAAGKSEVLRLLAQHGAVTIDADGLAREVVEPGTPGLQRIVDEFGRAMLTADGRLDREQLAEVVFTDEPARRRLEGIVHPLVRARSEELESAAIEHDPAAVVVHAIPLLVETGQVDRFDAVIVVDVSPERQTERLMTLRGMSSEQAHSRVISQAKREERLAAADVVLHNDGSLQDLATQVDELWPDLSRGLLGRRRTG